MKVSWFDRNFSHVIKSLFMVRKMDKAFDFKAVDHRYNTYKYNYGDFEFISLVKRSTTNDNSSSGTTPHSSIDRA